MGGFGSGRTRRRPGAGRPAKDPILRAIDGNAAHRRTPAPAASPAAGPVVRPSKALSPEARVVWRRLAPHARTRIASVRDGLRSILKLLSSAPGTVVVVDDYRLEPPSPALVKGARRSIAARSKPTTVASKRVAARKPARPAKRNKRASA